MRISLDDRLFQRDFIICGVGCTAFPPIFPVLTPDLGHVKLQADSGAGRGTPLRPRLFQVWLAPAAQLSAPNAV